MATDKNTEVQNKVVPQVDPEQAEPGKGAPGTQLGVQTAQQTHAVNPPDAQIPTDADVTQNKAQVKAVKGQEEGTGASTTDGFVIDEAGRLDNMPIEPPVYTEE